MTIEEVLAKDEKQIFDRKSIQIRPADLSETICASANADGGTIAVGISDKNVESRVLIIIPNRGKRRAAYHCENGDVAARFYISSNFLCAQRQILL